jgi:hypothetical protein
MNYEYSHQMKLIKQLIIKFLLTKEGYEQLLKRLPPNSRGTAEIYAYLASIGKEFSAIDLSIKLYEITLQIQPNYINYGLSLIHIYEISYHYSICLDICQVFCAKNLNLSIGKDRNLILKGNGNTNGNDTGENTEKEKEKITEKSPPLFTCADMINIMKYNTIIQTSFVNTVGYPSPIPSGSGSSGKSLFSSLAAPVIPSTQTTENVASPDSEAVQRNRASTSDSLGSGSTVASPAIKYLYYRVHYKNDETTITNASNHGHSSDGYATVERFVFSKEALTSSEDQHNDKKESSLSLPLSVTTSSLPTINLLSTDQAASSCFDLPCSSWSAMSLLNLPSVSYFDRELDLIALVATMVKIYYLQGNLMVIPLFIEKMEVIRKLSLKPLHKTLIRNEVAYYQDIIQILSYRTRYGWYGLQYLASSTSSLSLTGSKEEENLEKEQDDQLPADPLIMEYSLMNLISPWSASDSSPMFHPILPKAQQNPIYICGDSHCLSLGWNIIECSTSATASSTPDAAVCDPSYHLLIPKLVTGVKQWHLRNESSFYPKQNFYNAMNESIPSRSEVAHPLLFS